MTLKEQIHSWMAGREEEFLTELAKLIAIDSTLTEAKENAPFGEGNVKALEAALALAEKWGLVPGNDDNYVGTADINAMEDKLHILAHLDIVGVGEGWDNDPFTMVRDGDMIYGRGTNDDKGPAVAAMLAMRCVKELGLPLTGNARLILGTDEETGSRDILHYYSHHPFAPNSVTPDSTFPVTNVEKAHFAPKFGKTWTVQPASDRRLVSLSGGIRINVLPANCTARIAGMTAAEAEAVLKDVQSRTGVLFEAAAEGSDLVIQATGVQAHAAHADLGKNAVTATLEALSLLPLAQDEAAQAVKALNAFFPHGDMEGKAIGIAQGDAVSGKLSLVLSLLELNETGFWARFDSRDPICATTENTVDVVKRKMGALGWFCEGSLSPAHYVDENSRFIQILNGTYAEFSGKQGYCQYTGGGTYVHGIPGGVAFGALDPDFEGRAHGANERASIAQLMLTAEIYAAVIARVCA